MFSFIKKFVDYIYLRIYGVETSFGYVTLYGLPIIKKYKGSRIVIGKNVTLVSSSKYNPVGINHPVILATLSKNAIITIKDGSGLSGSSICSVENVLIGNNVGIGANSNIFDTDFHVLDAIEREKQKNICDANSAKVIIGNNVWISSNVNILKGVSLGNSVVVGCGAVVTKSFRDNVLIAGVPAILIK